MSALLLLASALQGCADSAEFTGSQSFGKAGRVTAVVADLSSGTNPYHRVFRRPWLEHPSQVIPGFPADAPALVLTLGEDWQKNVAADAATWQGMQIGVVYWVPGTNLLMYKHAPGPGLTANPADRLIYDDSHGTGTSSAMAKTCPDCYVLVMQDATSADGATARVVAEQMPWVDFVASTQISDFSPQQALDFIVPNPNAAYAQATRRLAESGRMFFAATGNTPVTGFVNVVPPLPIHNWNLPPWVVAIGGAHSACNASEPAAGDPQDFVGDFLQTLADVQSTTSESRMGGTSFATPQVAARFAYALLTLRRTLGDQRAPGALWAGAAQPSPYLDDGRLTAMEMVDAMSQTARYFATADYDPGCAMEHASLLLPTPTSPTPWLDMGWGYTGEAEALQAADLILGRATVEPKPADAVAFMDAFRNARTGIYGEAP